MRALWGGERAPVTLLGGMLGSGKTTLVNRLLATESVGRIVVLVNDVGEVAVDAALISAVTDDVIELTNGCVCCSFADGLGPALEQLREWPEPPERVLIELSGVAQPHRVVPWASTTGFALDGVVVCADVERIGEQLVNRWLADTAVAQLAAADVVVLTKTDLVSPPVVDRARRAVRAHTTAPVVIAADAPVPWLLVGAADSAPGPKRSVVGGSAAEWQVSTWSGTVANERALTEALAGLPRSVIRVKGVVADDGGDRLLVQRVGERTEISVSGLEPQGLVLIATSEVPLEPAIAEFGRSVSGRSE